jgi:Ca2+-transporting ATPase
MPDNSGERPVQAPDDAHAREVSDVLVDLEVDPETGLSDAEVERRRRHHGRNELGRAERASAAKILLDQVRSTVVVLLAVAAVVGAVFGEVAEAIAVFIVLVLNTATGFITELRAARSMESLQQLVTTAAEVERDDRRDEIEAGELVPGDIVGIEAGERIPADLRIIEAENLTVEESSLTGESEPVDKSEHPVDADAPLAERHDMLLMGTTAQTGRGRGVVTATGADTEVGRVAELAQQAEDTEAPLQAGLERLGRILSLVVVVVAGALAGIGILRGLPPQEVVEVSIALAIAVVPEGLPAVATLTLTVGMRRMARRNALVRRLPVVETLGSTTVICSDKTGTLTANRMEVVAVETGAEDHEQRLWETSVLCNDADIDPDGDPVGDPTEVGLLRGAEAAGVDWRALRERHPRQAEVPFSSETKRMATVVDGTVHVKGAPEALLGDGPLAQRAQEMAERALRTLAIARKPLPAGTDPGALDTMDDELFTDLEVLGVVGMEDPPRPEAVGAVESCHHAGIRVVMITGDQPTTAKGIAGQLGLRVDRVMTGPELAELSPEDLAQTVADVEVFARVAPEQKLQIVEALQFAGQIVAVTGDGVNDAPALRQANVGVSMGQTGTDVAREAADIVLADDDFSTIESAVEEGRRIFANIRRFAQFLFSWHLAEVLVITAGLVLGLPPALGGLMVLWNNLIIDVLPSFALALEPGREEVMSEPPRPAGEPVIGRPVITRILVQGGMVTTVALIAYFMGLGPLGLEGAQLQSLVFITLTGAQLLAVFNARTDHGSGFAGASRNRWLWGAIGLTLALEVLAFTVPPLSGVLGLESPPPAAWALAAGLVPLPLVLIQGARMIRDRR